MSVYDLSVPRPPAIDPEPPTPSLGWSKLGVAALTAFGALFYALGYAIGFMVFPLLVAGRWMIAALATGWDDAVTSWHQTGRIEP